VLGIPGRIEAGLLGGYGLLDGVVDDLLRALMIAALLRQNEYAEFHQLLPPPDRGRSCDPFSASYGLERFRTIDVF
jgi:hypothetical protein